MEIDDGEPFGSFTRVKAPMSVDIGYFSLSDKEMSGKDHEDQELSEEKSENEEKKVGTYFCIWCVDLFH